MATDVVPHEYSRVHKQTLSLLAIALAVFSLLLPPAADAGREASLDRTIQHLITYVARSDLTFVRNSGKYDGKQASEHMQKKYAHFRDRIKTPEDFIELCASRSLLSGKPYLVITEQGEISTHDWLTAELETYRNTVAGESR